MTGADRHGRFLFIGVSTGRSAIMRVFPAWAEQLRLGNVIMSGHDLPIHAEPSRYRKLVEQIRADPDTLGALVTTHKIDLFAACRDLFDRLDPLAVRCGEVSCISKAADELWAHAKDPISSGRSLDSWISAGYWAETQAAALLLGAGGANLAISVHLMAGRPAHDRPRRIIFTDRRADRLAYVRTVHESLTADSSVSYIKADGPDAHDRLMTALPRGSLVVNGTGMGKDIPGSPVSDHAAFPQSGMVWELNYRGTLEFLHQAARQEMQRHLTLEDGWRYFIHGWTTTIEEVFHVGIPPATFNQLAQLAIPLR